MEFVIFLVVMLVLDIVAVRWGFDSRDSLKHAERMQPTN